jgi:hypothetical protein
VHDFSLRLVREGLEEIRSEEMGEREVKIGKGLLIRSLLERGRDEGGWIMGERELADSCLNFLTAGEWFAPMLLPVMSTRDIGTETGRTR